MNQRHAFTTLSDQEKADIELRLQLVTYVSKQKNVKKSMISRRLS